LRFQNLYQFNPVAALVLASRNILLEGKAPPNSLLYKLTLSSFAMLALGSFVFSRLKRHFYDHL
jgi:lipopolysaccharide transport system permease protein